MLVGSMTPVTGLPTSGLRIEKPLTSVGTPWKPPEVATVMMLLPVENGVVPLAVTP